MSEPFDPDAAAAPGSGLFGLPDDPDRAALHVLAVPFDATTSYRPGTRRGPKAVLAASHQIDLYDRLFGEPYRAGIAWIQDKRFKKWNREARRLAEPIIEVGGHIDPADESAQSSLARIETLGEMVRAATYEFALSRLVAMRRADALSPSWRMVAAFGPIKMIPADSHASTKSGFSDSRP